MTNGCMVGIYAGTESYNVEPQKGVLWDARTASRYRRSDGTFIDPLFHGDILGSWISTNNAARALKGTATYVLDNQGRPGVRDGLSSQLVTSPLSLFNRTWCLVFTVNATNYWQWYGASDQAVFFPQGATVTRFVNVAYLRKQPDVSVILMMNNGTIRFWASDNVMRTLSFTPPTTGNPTVVTFQLAQSGTGILGTVISGATSNTATETVFPNCTVGETLAANFGIGTGSNVDLTTHSLYLSPDVMTKTDMEILHTDTKASWGII